MEESEGETGGLPLLLSCTHGTMIFLPEKKVEGRKEGRKEGGVGDESCKFSKIK